MPATPPGFLPLTCRRRLGPAGPRTLADETQAALRRALTLGTGTAVTQAEPPGSE
jgi:hypothetical protein